MLTDLCQELKNWFHKEIIFGTFTIADGEILSDKAQVGQYIRICGSVYNDGVYQFGTARLKDETFTGSIWLLAIPQTVIDLAESIDDWRKKYGGTDSAALSPFQSESFGGYSYSKGTTAATWNNTGVSWKSVFADELNRWRKI